MADLHKLVERQELEQAFGVFNELSTQLTQAYGFLEQRLAALTEELRQSRRERHAERAQKEHLADQLGVLLEALPAAIVLVDVRDRVDRYNPAAEQLFPGLSWGRRWAEIKAEFVLAEPAPGDWRLRDGRRASVSQRPLNDRGRVLVVVDVTEQRLLQERVERQDRLGAMGEMAAQLAHQVRTPLATAVLYAGHLASADLQESLRADFGAKLLDGLRHTENLVREMLAFSRGGSFTATPISLVDVLTTALDSLRPRLIEGAVQLDLRLDPSASRPVAGNVDALAGALSNLLDNALEHGGQDSMLRISLGQLASGVMRLCVEDDGPGIDPAIQARIFDPFFTTRERGTGLGLAVVQAVILEHGGTLRASDSALGGACFEITLPSLPVER